MYFKYSEVELNYLSHVDQVMAQVVKKYGYIKREVIPDLFVALVNTILGQQISTKAFQTIWDRFIALVKDVKPSNILAYSKEEIQKIGISYRKASYISELAQRVNRGEIDLEKISKLDDELVISELIKIKGVGRWTAEMMLIFSLERKDILSYDDLAIRRGLKNLYHEEITKERFNYYKHKFSPYNSIASFYIWAASIA